MIAFPTKTSTILPAISNSWLQASPALEFEKKPISDLAALAGLYDDNVKKHPTIASLVPVL